MKIYDIILIGIALSMDACAITIANCATYKKTLNRKKELSMPIAFGLFQGIMPLIGFSVGSLFISFLSKITDYLSAGVFFILSAKIIYDIVKEKCKENEIVEVTCSCQKANLTLTVVLIQALATSIDALIVGVTFINNLAFSVYLAVCIIVVVTFILVIFALYLGKYLGKLFEKYAEWVGAGILLVLAIKSLITALL